MNVMVVPVVIGALELIHEGLVTELEILDEPRSSKL